MIQTNPTIAIPTNLFFVDVDADADAGDVSSMLLSISLLLLLLMLIHGHDDDCWNVEHDSPSSLTLYNDKKLSV